MKKNNELKNCKTASELTAMLIRIKSMNPGTNEKEMEEAISTYLDDCGAVIEKDIVEEGRNNVIATIPGQNTVSKMIWICHMDTVVVGSGWSKNPLEGMREKNRIYGRGACDMKSGLACALSVFRKIAEKVKERKILLRYPLCLICTVDEEGAMKGVDHLIDTGFVKKNDFVMDLEPTGGEIQMAHKGRFWVELSIHGITAHASRPEEGADAIAAAGQIITEIHSKINEFPIHEELGRTTVTFGQINGGYQPYVVPDKCKLWMDFRLAPPVTSEIIKKILEEICDRTEQSIPGIQTEYIITGDRPSVETNPDSILLKMLQKAVKQTTNDICEPTVFPGYTDTAVIAGRLKNCECLSYGPGDLKYAHKPDEFVELKDIERCERVLEKLIELISETVSSN